MCLYYVIVYPSKPGWNAWSRLMTERSTQPPWDLWGWLIENKYNQQHCPALHCPRDCGVYINIILQLYT